MKIEVKNPGCMHSYPSVAGPAAKVQVEDEQYVMVYRTAEGENFGSIDVDFRHHIMVIYDNRPWTIHHMDNNGQTIVPHVVPPVSK